MSVVETKVFNNRSVTIEGWYWALRSKDLKTKQKIALHILGRDLVFYRSESGRVYAMDAHCPHMGAHLAEGSVEGENIRCLFHNWKFDSQGGCIEIPCQKSIQGVPRIKNWPVQEKYGLVWIWNGPQAQQPIPFVPELENTETTSILGKFFVKECHPNVMMINAIDIQHFTSVHQLPVNLNMDTVVRNENHIIFSNTTRVPKGSLLTRFIGRFYKGPLTYILSYWFASTGSVTVGPDFLHFHIIFSLRPTVDGKSEGQTILITKKRSGLKGYFLNPVLLFLSRMVGNHFAKGDTLIFKSIRFKMKFPIKADSAIISFIQHAEKQKTQAWGEWNAPQKTISSPRRHYETETVQAET